MVNKFSIPLISKKPKQENYALIYML